MKLSIVVLSWNKAGSDKLSMLKGCIESIRKGTVGEYELVIVDNGSDMEESTEYMKDNANTFVRSKINLGFGAGMDLGFSVAKGEYIAMVNDDIVVGTGWNEMLMQSCEDGFSMPSLLPLGHLTCDTDCKILKCDEFARDPKFIARKPGLYGDGAGFGALFLAKRKTYEKVLENGKVFDPRFKYAMFEDSDLWMRCDKVGVKRHNDLRTWVYHQGNGSVWKLPDFSAIYEANRVAFNDKWGTKR
jgi:glycosyltransferase involved in cell wall biosynthesis